MGVVGNSIQMNRWLFQSHNIFLALFTSAGMLFDSLYIFEHLGFGVCLIYGLIFSISFALVNIPLAKFSHKINIKVFTFLGILLKVFCAFLFMNFLSINSVFIIAVLYGLAVGSTCLTGALLSAYSFDHDKLGTQSAWYSNLVSLSVMASPLVAGLIIANFGYKVLFGIFIVGYLLSLIPLSFYKIDRGGVLDVGGDSPQLISEVKSLWKEYNFRSDVFRGIIDEFDIELYLGFVTILMFVVGGGDHVAVGWIVTVSSLIVLPMRYFFGKKFDQGSNKLSIWSGILGAVTQGLFFLTLGNVLWNTAAKASNGVSRLQMNFVSGVQFSSNIKHYKDYQYTAIILGIGLLFGIPIYVIAGLIYWLSGWDMMFTLYAMSLPLIVLPLIKVLFFNKQENTCPVVPLPRDNKKKEEFTVE